MIVTVTPNPSIDRTYRVGALRPGTLHRATAVTAEASGKGVNVSRVLRRLGTPTRAVVTSGGAEGRLLTQLLAAAGLGDTVAVPVAGPTRVNVTILSAGGEPTKVNEPGAALSEAEARRLVTMGGAVLSGATRARSAWLAVCGSLPAGTDAALIGELVGVARTAGAPVAVDASGDALRVAVDHKADLVKPNRDELAELAGHPVDTMSAAFAAAREVRSRTSGTVLLSLGSDGALLLTPAGAWHGLAPPIVSVNPTGAGDALLAGYLAGAAAADPADRLAAAVAIATSACLSSSTAELPERLVDPATVRVVPLRGA
jgi:1-phosphofructokinase